MKTLIKNGIITQLIAVAGALMLLNQVGLIEGWFAPNMVRLTSGNSTLTFTLSEASWLASYLKLGKLASVFLVAIFLDLAGSRKAILYSFIPVSISWLLTIIAQSTTYMYIAKFLSGISIGLTFGVHSIYLGEISAPNIRGTLNSITLIGWPLGILISTVTETYLSELVSCVIYLQPCILGMCLYAWLPESPYQLVKNKDLMKAHESLEWYRGANVDTQTEMNEIIEYVESTNKETFVEKLNQLTSRPFLKALLIVTVINTYPQLCGIFNVIFYMEIILTNAKSYLLRPKDMVIFVNVILLVANIVFFNLVDKVGRRMVLVVSSGFMTISLIGLGLHYYLLKYTGIDPTRTQELPVVAIITLLMAYTVGFGPAACTLLGEMFPASNKGIAVVISTFVSSFVGFVITKTYQPLVDFIGEMYVFWMYAVYAASVIPVVLVLIPETKGKSLKEIQNILNNS